MVAKTCGEPRVKKKGRNDGICTRSECDSRLLSRVTKFQGKPIPEMG